MVALLPQSEEQAVRVSAKERPLPRITIVTRLLWPGGVQRLSLEEARALQRIGYRVNIVFLRETAGGRLLLESAGPLSITLGTSGSNGPLGSLFTLVTMKFSPERGPDARIDLDRVFRFELRRRNSDFVLYTDQYGSLFSWLGRFLHRNKTIVWIQETFSAHPSLVRRVIERISLAKADLILTSTERNRQVLEASGYLGVKTLRFGARGGCDAPPFDRRENVAISVTVWDKGRHPEFYLEVAQHLTDGRIDLIGNWARQDDLDAFKRAIQERKLGDRLRVAGRVTEAELESHYRKAKVFMRVGYNEKGPGLGCLEAMGLGLPLIVNADLGIVEVVRDEVNGFVFERLDPQQIAGAISRLFAERELWDRLSKNNLASSRGLSWSEHASVLSGLICDIQDQR